MPYPVGQQAQREDVHHTADQQLQVGTRPVQHLEQPSAGDDRRRTQHQCQ